MGYTPFTIEKLLHSNCAVRHGINNNPPQYIINRLNSLLKHVLHPLQKAYYEKYGATIKLTSGYRCTKLNQYLCGRKKSNHKQGISADIKDNGGQNKRLYSFIKNLALKGKISVGNMINEYCYSWVHVDVTWLSINTKFYESVISHKVKDTQPLEGNIKNGSCIKKCR